jgi:HlyD family secretion protein
MKRVITILIVVAVLAGAGFAFIQYRNQQAAKSATSYQTVAAANGDLTASIGATGTVRSNQSADLNWKTSGTVQDVNVKTGDKVSPGDVLAKLDQASLPQNVILAQADLVNTQKTLDDLYTQAQDSKVAAMQSIATNVQAVKDAQYQLDNYTVPQDQAGMSTMDALDAMQKKLDAARQAFEPYKYFSSGNTTRQDLKDALDQAQSDYNAAVKRLEYEYDLAVAQANLDKARKDYEKWQDGPDPDDIAAANSQIEAAKATLSQAWIEAPFAGTITIAQPQPGDQVGPATQGALNTPAFRLDDLSTLLIDVQVSEVDINQVALNQDVTISFDAILNKEYHGSVVEVAQVGTSEQGVVDFYVTAKLDDADEQVKPGMTAAVNIVVSQLKDVLLVPNRAVRVQDSNRVVYVLQNNQPVPVDITLGASSDTMSQVLSGDLKVGDLIVLNPPTQFSSSGGPPPFVQGGGQ